MAFLAGAASAAPPTAVEKPVEVRRTPCPLQAEFKVAPSCFGPPEAAAVRGPVRKLERLKCDLADSAFGGEVPTLPLQVSGVEGSKPFTLRFLRKVTTGQTTPLPPTLDHAMLVGDALAGLTWGEGHVRVFWRDGTCEAPVGGPLIDLAALAGGEVVALMKTHDLGLEVLHREASGRWTSWGIVPRGLEPRLTSSGGRVVLHYETFPPSTEFGVLFPDLQRTEIVRRSDAYPQVMPHPAIAPLAPRDGSRWSSGAYAELDVSPGLLTVDRPAGAAHHRVVVAKLEALPGCQGADGRARVRTFSFPAIAELDARTSLVAVVERRGECAVETRAPPRPQCANGQPCREAPPTRTVTEKNVSLELILWAVQDSAREVARIPLGAERDGRRTTGLNLMVQGDDVYVMAGWVLLELDRVKLGGAR